MKLLDLRGSICPMNWVKTKLALEEMEPGEVIEVWLDDGEPIRNVPRSAAGEGHSVVRVAPQDSFFRVLLKRGGDS